MNGTELALHFPSSAEVIVSFDGTDSGKLAFANPVTDKDRTEIRWYVETYGARSLADPDDQEARRIKALAAVRAIARPLRVAVTRPVVRDRSIVA